MKKGSLSLSVNAIVIFVLAFAMLGFGLFVINMIQDQIGEKVPGIFDVDAWNPPPNAQTPIEFKGALTFKKGKIKTMGIGFYNKDSSQPAVPADKMDCGFAGTDVNNHIIMTGRGQTIDSSTWKPFEVKVKAGSGVEATTHICNIYVVKANSDGSPTTATGTNILATRQVSVNIEG